MTNKFTKNHELFFALILATVLLLQTLNGYGFDDWLPEPLHEEALKAAINDVAKNGIKKASDESKALVFLYNKKINRLAIRGRINEHEYQSCQAAFQEMNNHFIQEAARRSGFEAKLQTPEPSKNGAVKPANPGTDTDVIIVSHSGKWITLSDIDDI